MILQQTVTRFHQLMLLTFALITTVIVGQKENTIYPKLVVGIVVDQMRADYLYKYEGMYGEGGFKRLMREGFNFKNAQYNYVVTETAPGHASIYTGTTPSTHGIIGNSWYDRKQNDLVVNVGDSTVIIVGSEIPNPKGFSPHRLLSNTLGDELRQGKNFKSKVISISLKDRGAILPGGRAANAAYWHDWVSSPGYFVSSSYYMKDLPKWVKNFNKEGKSDAYLNTQWETLYPIEQYTQSAADNNNYEPAIGGKSSPTFPYDFKEMRERYKQAGAEYQLIWVSPAGNSLLTEFAIEALKREKLGLDGYPDLLAISYSATDVAGHTFGPQSVEIQDMYLRLDRNIEELLKALDQQVGAGNYTLFLTADHGAIPNAQFSNDHKLPAGIAPITTYQFALANFLNTKYEQQNLLEAFNYEQVYLDQDLILKSGLDLSSVQRSAADFLLTQDGIVGALTAHEMQSLNYEDGPRQKIQNGFHPNRSGDIILSFLPGYVQNTAAGMTIDRVKGTTHGSGYNYDSHVPLLWMGKGIPKGDSVREVYVT
ncbi:MAG: alkaline phosphatase family protein, partial [Flavobacteriaceae bacterium]